MDYVLIKKHNKSRGLTKSILNSKKINLNLKKECKVCGAKRDLQIHHEIYPLTIDKTIEAIEEGKICYVCTKCHCPITNDTENKKIRRILSILKRKKKATTSFISKEIKSSFHLTERYLDELKGDNKILAIGETGVTYWGLKK